MENIENAIYKKNHRQQLRMAFAEVTRHLLQWQQVFLMELYYIFGFEQHYRKFTRLNNLIFLSNYGNDHELASLNFTAFLGFVLSWTWGILGSF